VVRIYTRTGDDGTTGLIGGTRVPKDSPFTEACGSLDELNALLGVVLSYALPEGVGRMLRLVQDDLFTIGAELATPPASVRDYGQRIGDEEIMRLERDIDAIEAGLEPLNKFILPGGSPAGAALHLARAVVRRAERHCVTFSRTEPVSPAVLRYLNRLSDLCFVLARHVNRAQSIPEIHPTFGRPRE